MVAGTYFDAVKYDVRQYLKAEVDSSGSFSHLKRVCYKDRHNSL